jgi:hypothetical protein
VIEDPHAVVWLFLVCASHRGRESSAKVKHVKTSVAAPMTLQIHAAGDLALPVLVTNNKQTMFSPLFLYFGASVDHEMLCEIEPDTRVHHRAVIKEINKTNQNNTDYCFFSILNLLNLVSTIRTLQSEPFVCFLKTFHNTKQTDLRRLSRR